MGTTNPKQPLAARLRNWTLNAYAAAAWTDLVGDDSELYTIIVANTASENIDVQVRLFDRVNNVPLSIILPIVSIDAFDAKVVDFGRLAASANQRVQVQASASGVNFTAVGVA